MEEWRDYPGFEGKYQISNLSRIRNSHTGRVLKPHLHHSNYYTICFKKAGFKPKYLSRARVIGLVWIDNPENKKEINHINGITTDDSISNLEWVHPSENILHYYYHLDKGSKRKINVLDMNNNIINQYPSISMAVREMKLPDSAIGNIVTRLKGKGKSAYGFKWSYA